MTIAAMTRTGAGGQRRTRTSLIGLIAAVLLAGVSAALPRVPLLLYNRTPSMPTGLYVRVGRVPGRGDVIAFRLPRSAWEYARRRGEPTDIVLLKHVLAVGGDRVSTTGGRLSVDGVDIGPIPAIDSAGRALPQWRGDRVLAVGELLPGSTLPRSFDGRFFGPIRLADVLGVYRRVNVGSASPATDDGAATSAQWRLSRRPNCAASRQSRATRQREARRRVAVPRREGAVTAWARGGSASEGEVRVQCRAR